jgi:hypothetical protein
MYPITWESQPTLPEETSELARPCQLLSYEKHAAAAGCAEPMQLLARAVRRGKYRSFSVNPAHSPPCDTRM